MSIFGDIRNAIVSRAAAFLLPGEQIDQATRARINHLAELQAYYDGQQKAALKVKSGAFDDNLTVNMVALITDKSVSALVGDPADGKGVKFNFPSETEEETPASVEWLEEQWEANKRDIFLHKLALSGAETGFPAVKFVPDGSGNIRLLNLNSMLLRVETIPNDIDTITKYTIQYTVTEGKHEVSYRETTTPNVTEPDSVDAFPAAPTSWNVVYEKKPYGEKWQLVKQSTWEYPFAPILCWQNLPAIDTVYGKSDIEDIIPIQDRYNFLEANISKVIRLYGHPQRYSVNLSTQPSGDTGTVDFGPDQMPAYFSSDGTGKIEQLSTVGDLPAALTYLNHLHDSAFEIAREVDFRKDLAGRLTNFVMKILCKDMLDKLGTKRMLYGEAFREINRRMLVLGNQAEEVCEIEWPEPLPEDDLANSTAMIADLNAGLVSKQTTSEIRGYDWEKESARIDLEKQGSQNVGATLLQNFFAKGQTNGQEVATQPTLGTAGTTQKQMKPAQTAGMMK